MDLNIELIARVVHQANRVMQLAAGEEELSPKWDEAPEWQTESSIEGVKSALAGVTPVTLHELWSKKKLNEGWVYGEVKDPEKKTHPCLVPYLQLPQEQKIKDLLFLEIVKAFRDHQSATAKQKGCWACAEMTIDDDAYCAICGRIF